MDAPLRAVQSWVTAQPECPPLILRCVQDPRPGDATTGDATTIRLTGCAGALEPHEVLELVVLGAPAVIVDLGGCATPATARAQLAPMFDHLRSLHTPQVRLLPDPGDRPPHRPVTPGDSPHRRTGPARPGAGREHTSVLLDADHLPLTRRQTLLLEAAPPLPDETLSRHQRWRDAVLPLVLAASVDQPVDAAPLDADSAAPVLVAPGCDTCGVCVRACPLDALTIDEVAAGSDMSITTLSLLPSACDGCLRCVELCPPQVLGTDGRHPWRMMLEDRVVPVRTVPTRRCVRCRARIPVGTGGDRCVPCEQRHRNPFTATWPPHLAGGPGTGTSTH